MPEHLKHSDVVLSWGGMDPAVCRRYGVTVWGWGPYFDTLKIAEAYQLGFRIVSSLVNLNIREPQTTEVGRDLFHNSRLRRSTCVDIAGVPIVVPWWAREYGDDNRAYWHCTNNRLYREHLKRVVRNGVLAGGNAIHVDDSMANAMVVRLPTTGGCFCDACMAGFRDWLELRHSAAELAGLGIERIATFDYRDLVRPITPDRATYAEAWARGAVPLQGEFKLFQTEAAASFLGELVRCAKETAGEDVPVSANLGTMRPDVLLGAPHPDYFVIELHFWRPTGDLPLQPLKLAQALGKPCATWPVGYDVDKVRCEGATGMLKLWIAATYALGHNFMITHHMWCSTSAHGMIFYDAPEEEVLPLYRFVRDAAEVLDDFEETPQFGLLYSNRDARSERPVTEKTGWEMFNRNLSYQLLLAGDEYCASRLVAEAADPFDLVILPDVEAVSSLDAGQRSVVDGWLASGRAAFWADAARREFEPRVRVVNNPKVWAIARRRRTGAEGQVAIHLIDHDYNMATNSFGPAKRLSIEISRRLLGSRVPLTAGLRAPGAGASSVPVWADATHLRIELEMPAFWTVLVL